MVEKHGIFQGYYFFHHLGMNRDDARASSAASLVRSHRASSATLYDGPAFDPQAEILPLEHFEPMVRRVLAAPRQTIYTAVADGSAARA